MIRVSEIFGPTVQGEGALIGLPTVFVRTGGCDYRCTWCDTLYAVLPEQSSEWRRMNSDEILNEVKKHTDGNPILVTLSGGNPAMHDLEPLLDKGKREDFTFALETQGSIPRKWFRKLDWLFLSPKGPSSSEAVDWEKFDKCVAESVGPKLVLKVTVFNEQDYDFAKSTAERYYDIPMYLQVGNPNFLPNNKMLGADRKSEDVLMRQYRLLLDWVFRDKWFSVTVLPQLHVMVWGNERAH
ncbi:MAG: 7-carboxy-7-deazaguanine synthase QueE [Rhodospirillaceae bacterium]|nr:7-carboxy-7-deazaguanine synthase QueE [Rhodospirillaceae bacterium]|tara:strand:- start:1579 stop:2298 length:720 start_codon:yes stop_codon:yes gene_type:complete